MSDATVGTLGAVLGRMSAILDVTIPHNTAKELHWERVGKLPEESGEVFTAFLGWLGSNPRKGRTNEVDAVCDELLDVAVTALGAWEHLTGNQGGCGAALVAHAASKAARLEGFVPQFVTGERVRVRRGSWAADGTVTGVRSDQFDVPWMIDVQTDLGRVVAAHPREVEPLSPSLIDEIGDVPVVFWTCPDRTHRHVTWVHGPDGSVATCAVCGARSS